MTNSTGQIARVRSAIRVTHIQTIRHQVFSWVSHTITTWTALTGGHTAWYQIGQALVEDIINNNNETKCLQSQVGSLFSSCCKSSLFQCVHHREHPVNQAYNWHCHFLLLLAEQQIFRNTAEDLWSFQKDLYLSHHKSGISDTRIGVSRPRPVLPDCRSCCWDRDRDFSPCGLKIETETLLSSV
jgi:hypothetical protein